MATEPGMRLRVQIIDYTTSAPPKEGSAGNLWHRNYYEHVIRDQADLNRIRKYIEDNPGRWAEDRMKDNETPARHQTQP